MSDLPTAGKADDPVETPVLDVPTYDPEKVEATAKAKADEPDEVSFYCETKRGLVVAPGGRRRAQFENGRLTTSDPHVIRVCRSLDYVEEV